MASDDGDQDSPPPLFDWSDRMISVETNDLRRALLAVGPHAAKDPDLASVYRVRLAVGTENITVTATNLYSAGMAIVSVLEHDGELINIDLSCQDVAEILALFKPGKDEPGQLDLSVSAEHVTVTDSAGLFPGKSLRLPKLPVDDNFPDIRKLAWKKLTRQYQDPAERLVAAGALLALFKSAASAYGEQLALEMTGQNSALIVSCGESFLGFLSPIRTGEDTDALMNEHRNAWMRRLEDVAEELVPQ